MSVNVHTTFLGGSDSDEKLQTAARPHRLASTVAKLYHRLLAGERHRLHLMHIYVVNLA